MKGKKVIVDTGTGEVTDQEKADAIKVAVEVLQEEKAKNAELTSVEGANFKLENFNPEKPSPEALSADLEVLESLEDYEEKDFDFASKYKEFSKGEEITGIFKGFTVITIKNDDGSKSRIPAVIIRTKEFDIINGAIILVQSFSRISVNAVVRVKCIESKSGKAHRFEVKKLVKKSKKPAK